MYPAIATHDEKLIQEAIEYVQGRGIRQDSFEFQMLSAARAGGRRRAGHAEGIRGNRACHAEAAGRDRACHAEADRRRRTQA